MWGGVRPYKMFLLAFIYVTCFDASYSSRLEVFMAPLVQHVESFGRDILRAIEGQKSPEAPAKKDASPEGPKSDHNKSGYKRDTRKKADDVTVTVNIPGVKKFFENANAFLKNFLEGVAAKGPKVHPQPDTQAGEERPWYDTTNLINWSIGLAAAATAGKVFIDRIFKGIKLVDQAVAIARYFNTVTLPGIIYLVGYAGQALGLTAKLGWFMIRVGTWPVRIYLPEKLYQRSGKFLNRVDEFIEDKITRWNEEIKVAARKFKGLAVRFDKAGGSTGGEKAEGPGESRNGPRDTKNISGGGPDKKAPPEKGAGKNAAEYRRRGSAIEDYYRNRYGNRWSSGSRGTVFGGVNLVNPVSLPWTTVVPVANPLVPAPFPAFPL